MKIKIPLIILIPILIAVVLVCTRCTKKDIDETEQEKGEKIVAISRGEWKDNQYNNKFLELKYNLPEGWNKYSEEQIAQLMNVDLEMLEEQPKKIDELAEKQEVYVMETNDPSTGANVMIMFKKVAPEITAEYYLDNLKKQLDNTKGYETGRIYTETISGKEYKALNSKMDDFGMEQVYYVKKQENYIVNIIITTMKEGQQRQILKSFE